MNTQNKNKLKGVLSTIIFHSLFIIGCLFMGLTYYIPPPPEEGISIDFGHMNEGTTNIEPENNEETVEPIKEKILQKINNETEIVTQKIEEAPIIEADTESEEETHPEKDTEDDELIEEEQKINEKALYTRKEPNNKESEGEKDNEGNQGDIEGIESNNYIHGGGIGNDGIAYELGGRKISFKAKPTYKIQAQGKVVVAITVDRRGNVINALPGIKGSTTFNKYLLSKAKEAALKTTFNSRPNAPENQQGKIIYHFRLN